MPPTVCCCLPLFLAVLDGLRRKQCSSLLLLYEIQKRILQGCEGPDRSSALHLGGAVSLAVCGVLPRNYSARLEFLIR